MRRSGAAYLLVLLLSLCMAVARAQPADPPAVQAKANVTISGTVTDNLGNSICGLVLANGQFVFSCSPNGTYTLDAPLDAAGQVTLFAFADGHFPFKATLTSGGRFDVRMIIASPSAPANSNRDKTAQLIGGTWTYTYTIISTFSDSYSFSRVDDTPDSDGDYIALGTSSSGRVVGGGYVKSLNQWMVVAPGSIIDQVYTFSFSGDNNVSGCYYQMNPPGSGNLTRCYSMTGRRSPPKSMMMSSNPEQLVREAALEMTPAAMDPTLDAAYRKIRGQLQ
jgi:hypothetical protein